MTKDHIIDYVASALFLPAAPFLVAASRRRWYLNYARRLQDIIGVTVLQNHYYEPSFDAEFKYYRNGPRNLPGIDLNVEGQLEILRKFRYQEELIRLDGKSIKEYVFSYSNRMLSAGDAEALYSFIREFKPKTFIEIGAGNSSLVAQIAFEANRADNPDYKCHHICFEPFENPWLESIEAEIRRERIEHADLSIFETLNANDIVFIDSSHVVRSGGDVEHEFLRLLPILPKGIFVHVHDIFTPYDYPKRWKDQRRFWTEQYLLEAFLSFNNNFEIILALHDMHRRSHPDLKRAFPVLAGLPAKSPASFWMRTR